MAEDFKSYTQADVATGGSTVYTTPGSTQAIIIGLLVTNKSTTQAEQVDITATGVKIAEKAEIPVGGTLNILNGGKLVLEAAETIVATAATASTLDIHVSLLELS